MELQVGVKALLRNRDGKYLLLHRSPTKYPGVKGSWDIPGGRIDAGSYLIENLRREIKEETGLDLLKEPKLIAAQDIIRLPERHVVRLTYVANIEGEPVLDEEHVGYEWLSLDELKSWPDMDIYLKEVLDNGKLDSACA